MNVSHAGHYNLKCLRMQVHDVFYYLQARCVFANNSNIMHINSATNPMCE